MEEKEYLEKLEYLGDYIIGDCKLKSHKYYKELYKYLEAINEAKPNEALKYINGKIAVLEDDLQHYTMVDKDKCKEFYIREDLKQFTNIQQALLKTQGQEKENEILRKIIKSFFEKGCPLHQYIDKDFGLTIEVDKECSIMHLGEFKGVDLDKKLKEVLDNGENKINR